MTRIPESDDEYRVMVNGCLIDSLDYEGTLIIEAHDVTIANSRVGRILHPGFAVTIRNCTVGVDL